MTDAARLIALAEADLVCGDDGFWVFWPTDNNGALSPWMLRAIADELDRKNEAWAAQIEAHFSGDASEAEA